MKLVQITAGTGGFYCGNCVRDEALVKALARLGHEALMVPLYLPIVTGEPSGGSDVPLFYGGINVFLQQKLSWFRKTPRWLDALFDSTPLLRIAARKAGMTDAKDLGAITLSTLQGEEGKQAKELERLVDWLVEFGHPDVVCISNALLIGLARRLRGALGVPVVCTLQGEDGFLDGLPQPYRDQAWETLAGRAREIDAFIAVSHYYGEVMRRRLGFPSEQVHTVYNGISLDGYATARKPPKVPVIGFLARMCRDKGLHTLVRAFITLKQRDRVKDLRLRVAGSMTLSDRPFVEGLRKEIARAGVSPFVTFSPNLTRKEKIDFLEGLTVLSVPAIYGEAFGLYVLEAMAAGVPVVQPNHASFPELIEATGGGILFDPLEGDALADTLERLLLDPVQIRQLGEQGGMAVRNGFSMDRMAQEVVQVLKQVTANHMVAGHSLGRYSGNVNHAGE